MKAILVLLAVFLAAMTSAPAAAPKQKKRFILYAALTQDTVVDLADGARWAMDRGDCFPVIMFKEERTKVILQLAGTSFATDVDRVKILTQEQITPAVMQSYRRNVEAYINTRSTQWKALQPK